MTRRRSLFSRATRFLGPVFLVAAAVLVLLLGCTARPVRIGFAGPLTGIYSDLGVQGRNGATLAVEEINARGGLATGGVGRSEMELIARDDGNDPDLARQVDEELYRLGVTAIIGHMTSQASIAAVPLADERGIVLLSPTSSTPVLSDQKDMFFRIQGAMTEPARALGVWAAAEPGLDSIITIRDASNAAYGTPYSRVFSEAFRSAGGRISGKIIFESRTVPEAEIMHTIAQAPDAVLVIASARDTAGIAERIRRGAPETRILSSGWGATVALLQQAGATAEGIIAARSVTVHDDSPAYQDFVEKYRRRFGSTPSFAAVQGYDTVRVLAEALKETGGGRRGLPEALVGISGFPGLYGPITLNETGDVRSSVGILEVRGGAFVPVDRQDAEGEGAVAGE